MSIKKAVLQLELQKLRLSGRTLTLGDSLLMDDNLYANPPEGVPSRETGDIHIGPEEPFKQMFINILACLEGHCTARLNLKDFTLGPGDILIAYPGVIIDKIEVSPDLRIESLAIKDGAFFTENQDNCIQLIRKNLLKPVLIHATREEFAYFQELYGMMRTVLSDEKRTYKKDAAGGFLRVMAASLAEWISRAEGSSPSRSREERLLMDFLQEVQTHCSRERRITFYASRFCISPKYFAKLIFEASGKHPAQWIKDYVILEAKAMLKTGNYTVQQVSDAMNFPNSSFFGKYFKSAVGCSPRKYMIEG